MVNKLRKTEFIMSVSFLVRNLLLLERPASQLICNVAQEIHVQCRPSSVFVEIPPIEFVSSECQTMFSEYGLYRVFVSPLNIHRQDFGGHNVGDEETCLVGTVEQALAGRRAIIAYASKCFHYADRRFSGQVFFERIISPLSEEKISSGTTISCGEGEFTVSSEFAIRNEAHANSIAAPQAQISLYNCKLYVVFSRGKLLCIYKTL